MTKPRDTLRVAKKFLPGQPGTLKLARTYGDALVCVRYRVDAEGLHRYTTVDLVVDRMPIVKRVERIVGVRVLYEETTLQSAVRAGVVTWDKTAKLWRMPYRVTLGLSLRDRIVET